MTKITLSPSHVELARRNVRRYGCHPRGGELRLLLDGGPLDGLEARASRSCAQPAATWGWVVRIDGGLVEIRYRPDAASAADRAEGSASGQRRTWRFDGLVRPSAGILSGGRWGVATN